MAILITEIERLLRAKWPDATSLAEELYAILQADVPFTSDQPIQVTQQNPNLPAVQVTQPSAGPVIQVTTGVPQGTTTLPGLPPLPAPGDVQIATTPDGGLTFGGTSINFSVPNGQGVNTTYQVAGTPNGNPQLPTLSGGAAMPGQVQSGSGSTYTVTVYPAGTTGAGQSANVTQLSIDPSETIPAGTWAIVSKTTDGSYYMQVPVWGADLT